MYQKRLPRECYIRHVIARFYIALLMVLLTFVAHAQDERTIDSLLGILRVSDEDTNKVKVLHSLCSEYINSNPDSSLLFITEALDLAEQLNYRSGLLMSHNQLGNLAREKGEYKTALTHFIAALKIAEESGLQEDIAKITNNIGALYFLLKNYEKSIDFFQKCQAVFEEMGDKPRLSVIYNNIAGIYNSQGKYQEALGYFEKAYGLAQELEDKESEAIYLTNIGIVNMYLDKLELALENLQSSIAIKEELGNIQSVLYNYLALGEVYIRQKNYDDALWNLNKCLKLSKKVDNPDIMKSTYKLLSGVYQSKKEFEKSLEYFQLYSEYRDSLLNEENSRQIAQMQVVYETEKQEKEIELLNKDKKLQAVELKENRLILVAFAGGFTLVLAFSLLLYNRFRITRRQKSVIEQQKLIVDEKNRDITDSITYASNIQAAILPTDEQIRAAVPDSFVLFKPKDIVSGDFYWFANQNGKVFIAACDCTGHGVPGAFVSIIGNDLLNQIIIERGIGSAGEILSLLNQGMKSVFTREGEQEAQDGMDMALCVYDLSGEKLQFSGAKNPLILIRNKELTLVSGDRTPVGGPTANDYNFTNHDLDLEKGDHIYIFSDGYTDQFQGMNGSDGTSRNRSGKKFMKKRFEELLISVQNKPMDEQKEILNSTIEEWKGDVEQIDDILVIGIRI